MKGCLYAGKCLLMRTSLGAEDSKQEINKKVKKSKKQNQSLRPKEEEMKSRKRESTVNREEFHFNILTRGEMVDERGTQSNLGNETHALNQTPLIPMGNESIITGFMAD
ncbi:hypothetical protein RUM44_013870 [Polyplax serrata]|uniref:Uncharacterized protein n=1 Tax=Polyplax serrata TaxID=468196 RepID=A0ABR1BJH0_POLSC